MRRGVTWWTATVLGLVALLLVGAEAALVMSNQATAARVTERRTFIAQTPQLTQVTQLVASALVSPAASDEAIRSLLSRSGVRAAPR